MNMDCPFTKRSCYFQLKGHEIGNIYRLVSHYKSGSAGGYYLLARTKYISDSTYRVQLISMNGCCWSDGIDVDLCCRNLSQEEFSKLTDGFPFIYAGKIGDFIRSD